MEKSISDERSVIVLLAANKVLPQGIGVLGSTATTTFPPKDGAFKMLVYIVQLFSLRYFYSPAHPLDFIVYGSRCQKDETKGQTGNFVTKLEVISLLPLNYFLLEFQNMVTYESHFILIKRIPG